MFLILEKLIKKNFRRINNDWTSIVWYTRIYGLYTNL